MLIKLNTDKTVNEVADAMQLSAKANHLGVMQIHNLKETMSDARRRGGATGLHGGGGPFLIALGSSSWYPSGSPPVGLHPIAAGGFSVLLSCHEWQTTHPKWKV